MYLESAIVGIMQGLNQQKKSLIYSLIDSALRISLICFVLPRFGINGFIFIMYVSNLVTSCLNAYRVLKISNTKFDISSWVIKPLASIFSACVVCVLVSKYVIITNTLFDMVFKAGIITVMYLVMLFLFGIVKKKNS